MEKSFFEVFRRYEASEDKRALLLSAHKMDVRLCREPMRVEVDLYFSERKDFRLLYAIEDELCALYDARSFRILPKYPAALFSLSVMPEILAEAERIGIVTHGFFAEPHFSLDGNNL